MNDQHRMTSDPSHIRGPNVLVHLNLISHRQPIGEHPFGQLPRVQRSKHRAEQHRASMVNPIPRDRLFCPFVVGPILNDELGFIVLPEARDIGPVHPIRHAAARALDVQDDMHPRINRGGIDRTTGFEQDRESLIAQPGQQHEAFRLRERFSACHLHQGAAICANGLDDLINRLLAAAVKGIVRIAPGTAERATGQAHEDAGPSGERRLTLDAMENFRDAHMVCYVTCGALLPSRNRPLLLLGHASHSPDGIDHSGVADRA